MLNPALDNVLSNPALPSLPMVAVEVLELTSRHDVNLREIERAIERDQAMASRVLRTVNSSYYGLPRRCGSIRQAVAFLGLETVKSLVLGFSLVRISDGCDDEEVTFDFIRYWRRSFFSASVARTLAEAIRSDVRIDVDEAFISALIQDVGMVVLWRAYGDRYLQIVDMSGSDHDAITTTERRTLEVDHPQIGSEMTRRWSFPETITAAIADHHRPFSKMTDSNPLVRVVRLASAAVELIDPGIKSTGSAHQRFERQAMNWFRIRPDRVRDILETSLARAQELATTLDMNNCEIPSIEEILSRADDARSGMPDALPPETPVNEEAFDETTGLLTRTRLLSDLEDAFSTDDGDHPVSLFLLGIDEVRVLNERLGDSGGDAALAHVGGCVREFVDACSTEVRAYRFVGAEIAIILGNLDSTSALEMAEQLRSEIACRPARVTGRDGDSEYCSVHVTIGVGTRHGESPIPLSPDGLLRAAMCAVTAGRRLGGDRVHFQGGDATELETGIEAA